MSDPLLYGPPGNVVLQGAFSADGAQVGSQFGITIRADAFSIQPVRVSTRSGEVSVVQHNRLSLHALTRTFMYSSLLHEKKIDIEFSGIHVGGYEPETHHEMPLFLVVQPVSHVAVRARYSEAGLKLALTGSLLPPRYV